MTCQRFRFARALGILLFLAPVSVLWVRSYNVIDAVEYLSVAPSVYRGNPGRVTSFVACSENGSVTARFWSRVERWSAAPPGHLQWTLYYPSEGGPFFTRGFRRRPDDYAPPWLERLGFQLSRWPRDGTTQVVFPLWFLPACVIGPPLGARAARFPARWLRRSRSRRRRRGRCVRCSYDLTGNVSGVCPECGEPVETATS